MSSVQIVSEYLPDARQGANQWRFKKKQAILISQGEFKRTESGLMPKEERR